MGCHPSICSGKASAKEERAHGKAINHNLQKEAQKQRKEVKLLLLGGSDCGKSTIFKQVRIIYLQGFKQHELESYKSIISNNILESMRTLVRATLSYGYTIEDSNQTGAKSFLTIPFGQVDLTAERVATMKTLLQDEGIQNLIRHHSNTIQITESFIYFFQNIDRVSSLGYVPNQEDCLRARLRTTGITECEFKAEGIHFRMVDVGGQRSERRKWIHCFEGVTAVLFCASLSEYDQTLEETPGVNRMMESLALFEETCQARWFYQSSIILFLNKSDVFKEEISRKDLTCCFPNYTGGCNFDAAVKFIEQQFLGRNQGKVVYTHVTCATDTKCMRFVLSSVKDIVIKHILRSTGL